MIITSLLSHECAMPSGFSIMVDVHMLATRRSWVLLLARRHAPRDRSLPALISSVVGRAGDKDNSMARWLMVMDLFSSAAEIRISQLLQFRIATKVGGWCVHHRHKDKVTDLMAGRRTGGRKGETGGEGDGAQRSRTAAFDGSRSTHARRRRAEPSGAVGRGANSARNRIHDAMLVHLTPELFSLTCCRTMHDTMCQKGIK